MAKRKDLPKGGARKGVVSTLGEVAKAFGVRHQTARTWVSDGMPGSAGAYDLAKIDQWKKSRSRDPDRLAAELATAVAGEVDPDDLLGQALKASAKEKIAKARIAEATAQKRERENRVASGQVADRDEIERLFSEMHSALRDELSRIPEEMKASFPAKCRRELAEALKARINMALTNYVARGKAIGG